MPDLTGFATLQDFASRQGFDKSIKELLNCKPKQIRF